MKQLLRRALIALAVLLLGAEGVLLANGTHRTSHTLTRATEAHFIDVGQGDATLLLSGGQAVLIDAGTPEAGSTVVSYLREQGVSQLYAAVATHPHADHIGGMAAVVEAFPVEHFYMGSETASTKSFSQLLDALEKRGVQPTIPQDGDTLAFSSGASLTFLGPADDVSADNMNDRSLIALFQADDCRLLLMGDAEAAAETSLLTHHPEVQCEVLKVGHHGGDTSTSAAFLAAVQPETAVISCGRNNDYGHPSAQTLENLSQAGAADVRITAQDGSVVYSFSLSTESKENAA